MHRLPLLLALFLLACSSREDTPPPAPGPTAPATPAADPAPPVPPPPPGAIPAPSRGTRIPLATGQWVRYRISGGRQPDGELTYKVLEREDEAHWLEVEVTGGGQAARAVFRMLVNASELWSEGVEIKKAEMLAGGRRMRLTPAMLRMANRQIAQYMDGLFKTQDMTSEEREDVTVPAGTYLGCYIHRNDIKLSGMTDRSVLYYHPIVPVLGFVKLVGQDGRTFELLESGNEGATSSMP